MGFTTGMYWKGLYSKNAFEGLSYRNKLERVLLLECIGKAFTIINTWKMGFTAGMYLNVLYTKTAFERAFL